MSPEQILSKVTLGMTRTEAIAALGQPTDISIVPKKKRHPRIFKYGDIELHFSDGVNGKLILVYSEDEHGEPKTYLSSL